MSVVPAPPPPRRRRNWIMMASQNITGAEETIYDVSQGDNIMNS
jgi:hypothetical protein